jgi:hypothetical protein
MMVVAEPQKAPELEGSDGSEATGGEPRAGTAAGGMTVTFLLSVMTELPNN